MGERVRFLDSQQGRLVKSCTTPIFDEEGSCHRRLHLNMDVTDLVLADSVIRRLVQVDQTNTDPSGKEAVFVENVDDVLEYFLKQIERQIGKPAAVMTREEKVQALSYLEEKGVFKISKASVALCERFQISKYTLYGYLDEARQA
ncbi:MAG: helix-turn-helix domain-containing protein [Lachnospiraceae bacterium]